MVVFWLSMQAVEVFAQNVKYSRGNHDDPTTPDEEAGGGRSVIYHISLLRADYDAPEYVRGGTRRSTHYPIG